MRLLVLTYHFPPDGAVGGQRWAGLSKYLARMGWEVHVITAAPAPEQPLPPGVHRHVRARRPTLNDRYKQFASRRRAEAGAPAAPASEATSAPASTDAGRSALGWAIMAARRVMGASLSFPDVARGWVGGAAEAARELLRDRKFDIVVSSGPPHLAHFAAMFAMKGYDIPHVIDMRDAWAVVHERHSPVEDFIVVRGERLLLSGLERLMFAHASRIVVNTQEYTAALRRERPDLDVVWFPNGVDVEQLPQRRDEDVVRGSISHVGALYAGRNLSAVFRAMRAVLDERPDAAKVLHVNVVGGMDAPHRNRMVSELVAQGLDEMVTIHGAVPRDKAIDLLNRTHLALVLAQNQGIAVPAKLYESVGLGVPTLVIAEEGSASAREARRIGALCVDGDDAASIRQLLLDMLDGKLPTRMDAIAPITYPDLAVQMDKLLRDVIAHRHR